MSESFGLILLKRIDRYSIPAFTAALSQQDLDANTVSHSVKGRIDKLLRSLINAKNSAIYDQGGMPVCIQYLRRP
jgi:hypothetical protein